MIFSAPGVSRFSLLLRYLGGDLTCCCREVAWVVSILKGLYSFMLLSPSIFVSCWSYAFTFSSITPLVCLGGGTHNDSLHIANAGKKWNSELRRIQSLSNATGGTSGSRKSVSRSAFNLIVYSPKMPQIRLMPFVAMVPSKDANFTQPTAP